jgi:hypothetical protein
MPLRNTQSVGNYQKHQITSQKPRRAHGFISVSKQARQQSRERISANYMDSVCRESTKSSDTSELFPQAFYAPLAVVRNWNSPQICMKDRQTTLLVLATVVCCSHDCSMMFSKALIANHMLRCFCSGCMQL